MDYLKLKRFKVVGIRGGYNSMKLILFEEAAKIWKKTTIDETSSDLSFELEMHKRLLNFFQVGEYYYFIFNTIDLRFDLISKEVGSVLGYSPEEMSVNFLIEKIHPEDQPWFLNFENKTVDFFSTLSIEQVTNYKVRYDYRIKKSNGEYIRILQQVVTIDYDKNGRVLRTFGVHTNISHLKTEGDPVLSFIGLNGEPSYIDVGVEKIYQQPASFLSPREREVLLLIADGKESKVIANDLNISKETVSTHRKNLLAKTNARNSAELVKKAIREGWI